MKTDALLDEEIKVDPEDIEHFQKYGHVFIKQVLPKEWLLGSPHKKAIEQAVNPETVEEQLKRRVDNYSDMFLQACNIWEMDPTYAKQLVMAKRMASVAKQLLKCDKIRLYSDQSLFKFPDSEPTPWHSDIFYWPFDNYKQALTMWMPLEDLVPKSGTMRFALGTHDIEASEEKYSMKYVPISTSSGQYYEDIINKHNIPIKEYPDMQAGDATFHLSSTIHAAHGNYSDRIRKAFTVRYIADGMRVMNNIDNENRRYDRSAFIPDRQEGEIIDGWKNPVLC